MTQQTTNQPAPKSDAPVLDWRTRSYLIWTAVGALFGVVSGYMYTRAAKEYADRNGNKPPEPGTLEVVGLVLALMAVVRQIAELAKPNDTKKS